MWNTPSWIKRQIRAFRIRRWFAQMDDGGELEACKAMWHLNRHARAGGLGKTYIYDLKQVFIRHLYRPYEQIPYKPKPTVTVQEQVLECHSCEDGVFWHHETPQECYRCGGTGVYDTHLLYRFEFTVSGRTFVWHQPKALVDYPVRVSTGGGKYESGPRGREQRLDEKHRTFLLCVLQTYLEMHTDYRRQPLREAVADDVEGARRRLRYRIRRRLDICPDCGRPSWLGRHEGHIPF